jgi:hypothetical protein
MELFSFVQKHYPKDKLLQKKVEEVVAVAHLDVHDVDDFPKTTRKENP